MPLYTFNCEKCGAEFETIAKFGEIVPCDNCDNKETTQSPVPRGSCLVVYDNGSSRKIRSNK